MAETSLKQQIVDTLTASTNVLITVNNNPSVDELSAALAMTLIVNKLDKHGTAVFSGAIPSAIEFLEPEKTFESTVDSLRDFIIALDKEKADHLRYKVDGDVVKIFITPYRSVLDERDLDFSQGDYNVDMVIAIGVKSEDDLDHALSAHGRILHDATVVSLSLDEPTKLGNINIADPDVSSYSELLETVVELMKNDKKLLDEQVSTAFLTGIVAATDRFSNDKTSPGSMTVAAKLMSSGANQQLIATKLEDANAISSAAASPVYQSPEESHGGLQEGKTEKIKRSSKDEREAEGVGALSISHMPSGTLDEITEQVHHENQQRAILEAEQELRERGVPSPSANDNLKDVLERSVEPSKPTLLKGAVSVEQWKSPDAIPEPSFGGTLNATTEQAAADKQREMERDRNHTLLNHNTSRYASDEPQFQSPLNAFSTSSEFAVDPLSAKNSHENSDDMTSPTIHAQSLQPVMASEPTAPAVLPSDPPSHVPTLAEIDAQNRAKHDDALSAVHDAFGPSTSAQNDTASGFPALPPLPPMPDFSTLPPMPGASMPQSQPEPSVPEFNIFDQPLGNTLPPIAEPSSQSTQPSAPSSMDPSQFKIPGQ